MPGMMRSRVTGCRCVDCSGGWTAIRAAEKRQWQRDWADEQCSPDREYELRRRLDDDLARSDFFA